MIGIINFITIMLLINALVYFFNHLDMLPIYKGGLDLQSFCYYIDKNSDPGAPLTFLTIDVENGVPRYEKAPYHVLPGELFAYEIELIGGIKPIFCLVLKHDYDQGRELTKEILLDEILRSHQSSPYRCVNLQPHDRLCFTLPPPAASACGLS